MGIGGDGGAGWAGATAPGWGWVASSVSAESPASRQPISPRATTAGVTGTAGPGAPPLGGHRAELQLQATVDRGLVTCEDRRAGFGLGSSQGATALRSSFHSRRRRGTR